MDITPHVNLLKSLRGDRIDYVLLVGEGVDNSLDAGATKIGIILDNDEISFQDNGVGITSDRITSVFSLGDHGPMTTTQLGRFGVGIKSQAVNAGNIFQIVSVSRDGRVKLSVDWRKILRSGHWSIDDPRWIPVPTGSATGTTISIADLRSTKSPIEGWPKRIKNDLMERFYPAIKSHCTISLNGEQIALLPEPMLTDLIDRQIALSNGRSAHLRAGILAQPSRLNRLHVAYKHRVIIPASSFGCGDYGGLTKMFGRLQLFGAWHLAKFKNDLTDEDEREELEDAVLEILRPILEKCNSASLSAKVNEISHLINDLVPPELTPARPQRKKDPDGPILPRKPRKPGEVDPDKSKPDPLGPAKSRRPPQNKLLITFDGIAEQDGVGAFQAGRPHRVNLSKDDPHVARLLEHRDLVLGVHSLYALAIAIFENGRQTELPQQELPLEGFGKRIARLLSMQDADKAVA